MGRLSSTDNNTDARSRSFISTFHGLEAMPMPLASSSTLQGVKDDKDEEEEKEEDDDMGVMQGTMRKPLQLSVTRG
ncbi:hypothetical protein KQX54_003044 [Cotesia glomerata]|uniref:Uncharacterized protein n=1 Tax=Cotesia glomerata TaxID=32391 RepID=A0AAV7HHA6_COTGL|nr:hypothetical protein KQX54_003044 [Cotesia glomerata]